MITINDIVVRRSGRTILGPVSTHFDSGAFHVVMGPNGAGKSTLLHSIAGDTAPTSGRIHIAGTAIDDVRTQDLALVRSVVSQVTTVGLGIEALDYVLQGRFALHHGRPSRDDYCAAIEAMERCHVEHLTESDMRRCSGGELQRIAIARAIAQLNHDVSPRQRLLLLDEPSAHLDPLHQHLVLSHVRSMAAELGWCVIAILHDPALALRYADTVTLLEAGRLRWCGPSSDAQCVANMSSVYNVTIVTTELPDGLLAVGVRP
jgi:iron complex transport system ATP-binding protein